MAASQGEHSEDVEVQPVAHIKVKVDGLAGLGLSRDHLEFYVINFDEQLPALCYIRDRQSQNGIRVNGHFLGAQDAITPGHCLQDGDVVTVPVGKKGGKVSGDCRPQLTFYFCQELPERPPFSLKPLQRKEAGLFSNRYRITDRPIGDGAHAKVYLSVESATNRQVACRVVDMDALRRKRDAESTLRRLRQEVDTLRQLHHPNIISYVHAVQSPHTLYCFTELATGGDLFSFVQRRLLYGPAIREGDLKMIVRQVVDGISYLHKAGVVHRDLKPENVLFAIRPTPDYRIVLSDLGHSGLQHHRLKSLVGTEQYIAPYVVQR
ncbi:hypothetical protein ACRALDRAFT_2029836 [Sodiomyces alcalophilus JCM 7366]|uniref:uncharacterized protein n=1 Tax=Sodiomyces alcalophilus JCM 7366 TaxID=591952 RepID=UPI0039B4434D